VVAQDLNIDIEELVSLAKEAASFAHAPYSNFRVGAALLTSSGDVITGSNVENVSYGLTICAERAAVVRAVSEGHHEFRAIAVAVEPETGASGACCGACLQVLAEFDPNEDLIVIYPNAGAMQKKRLSELLPVRFRP
jgi:cytidine deaminase